MSERPNIVGPEYIAELLGMEVSTVKVDARRKPESLPPRLELPGHRKLRWVEDDVISWLNSFRRGDKKKVGRPVSPAYQQSLQGQDGSTA